MDEIDSSSTVLDQLMDELNAITNDSVFDTPPSSPAPIRRPATPRPSSSFSIHQYRQLATSPTSFSAYNLGRKGLGSPKKSMNMASIISASSNITLPTPQQQYLPSPAESAKPKSRPPKLSVKTTPIDQQFTVSSTSIPSSPSLSSSSSTTTTTSSTDCSQTQSQTEWPFEELTATLVPLRTKRRFSKLRQAKRLPHRDSSPWQIHALITVSAEPVPELGKSVAGSGVGEHRGRAAPGKESDEPDREPSYREDHLYTKQQAEAATAAFVHYRGASFEVLNPHASLVYGHSVIETPGAELDGLLDDYLAFDTSMEQSSNDSASSTPHAERHPRLRRLISGGSAARRAIFGTSGSNDTPPALSALPPPLPPPTSPLPPIPRPLDVEGITRALRSGQPLRLSRLGALVLPHIEDDTESVPGLQDPEAAVDDSVVHDESDRLSIDEISHQARDDPESDSSPAQSVYEEAESSAMALRRATHRNRTATVSGRQAPDLLPPLMTWVNSDSDSSSSSYDSQLGGYRPLRPRASAQQEESIAPLPPELPEQRSTSLQSPQPQHEGYIAPLSSRLRGKQSVNVQQSPPQQEGPSRVLSLKALGKQPIRAPHQLPQEEAEIRPLSPKARGKQSIHAPQPYPQQGDYILPLSPRLYGQPTSVQPSRQEDYIVPLAPILHGQQFTSAQHFQPAKSDANLSAPAQQEHDDTVNVTAAGPEVSQTGDTVDQVIRNYAGTWGNSPTPPLSVALAVSPRDRFSTRSTDTTTTFWMDEEYEASRAASRQAAKKAEEEAAQNVLHQIEPEIFTTNEPQEDTIRLSSPDAHTHSGVETAQDLNAAHVQTAELEIRPVSAHGAWLDARFARSPSPLSQDDDDLEKDNDFKQDDDLEHDIHLEHDTHFEQDNHLKQDINPQQDNHLNQDNYIEQYDGLEQDNETSPRYSAFPLPPDPQTTDRSYGDTNELLQLESQRQPHRRPHKSLEQTIRESLRLSDTPSGPLRLPREISEDESPILARRHASEPIQGLFGRHKAPTESDVDEGRLRPIRESFYSEDFRQHAQAEEAPITFSQESSSNIASPSLGFLLRNSMDISRDRLKRERDDHLNEDITYDSPGNPFVIGTDSQEELAIPAFPQQAESSVTPSPRGESENPFTTPKRATLRASHAPFAVGHRRRAGGEEDRRIDPMAPLAPLPALHAPSRQRGLQRMASVSSQTGLRDLHMTSTPTSDIRGTADPQPAVMLQSHRFYSRMGRGINSFSQVLRLNVLTREGRQETATPRAGSQGDDWVPTLNNDDHTGASRDVLRAYVFNPVALLGISWGWYDAEVARRTMGEVLAVDRRSKAEARKLAVIELSAIVVVLIVVGLAVSLGIVIHRRG